MPRRTDVTYVYVCDQRVVIDDQREECGRGRAVVRGDRIPTGRSLEVHDQADADAVVRQDGWTVGRRVRCPAHAGGAS